MNDFPAPDTFSTLAIARDAYAKLLAAYFERTGAIEQLEGDLKAANELIDENGASLTKSQNDLKARSDKLEQSQRDLTTAKQTIKSLEEKVEALESEAQSAEAKAAEICASVGVDPVQIKPEGESEPQDLMEQFQAIKDPGQRTAFFRKHKDQLISRQ